MYPSFSSYTDNHISKTSWNKKGKSERGGKREGEKKQLGLPTSRWGLKFSWNYRLQRSIFLENMAPLEGGLYGITSLLSSLLFPKSTLPRFLSQISRNFLVLATLRNRRTDGLQLNFIFLLHIFAWTVLVFLYISLPYLQEQMTAVLVQRALCHHSDYL